MVELGVDGLVPEVRGPGLLPCCLVGGREGIRGGGGGELRLRKRGSHSSRHWCEGRRVGTEARSNLTLWEVVREGGMLGELIYLQHGGCNRETAVSLRLPGWCEGVEMGVRGL